MTLLEFEVKIKELVGFREEVDDIEDIHKDIDNLLCEILNSLGYQNGIAIYKAIPKWYARLSMSIF